jgi:hypothetical protein
LQSQLIFHAINGMKNRPQRRVEAKVSAGEGYGGGGVAICSATATIDAGLLL